MKTKGILFIASLALLLVDTTCNPTDKKHETKRDYKLLDEIGIGFAVKVKLAQNTKTGDIVAVKIIDKNNFKSSDVKQVELEIKIMRSLNHPNIAKFIEAFEIGKITYIVMEHGSGGDLFNYIKNNGAIPESLSRRLIRQIIRAVAYCHRNGIVHRDLKLANFVLDGKDISTANIKLIDFGVAAEFTNENLETFVGSPEYCAPEYFLRKPYNGPKYDVWSLGVVFYMMITGGMPFKNIHDYNILKKAVIKADYIELDDDDASPSCCEFIRKFLKVEPKDRPDLHEIVSSVEPNEWLNIGYVNDPIRPSDEH